jgi:hypothetical protein
MSLFVEHIAHDKGWNDSDPQLCGLKLKVE